MRRVYDPAVLVLFALAAYTRLPFRIMAPQVDYHLSGGTQPNPELPLTA